MRTAHVDELFVGGLADLERLANPCKREGRLLWVDCGQEGHPPLGVLARRDPEHPDAVEFLPDCGCPNDEGVRAFYGQVQGACANGRPPELAHETTTWAPVELQALIEGGELEQPPALLARTDGACLLYRGKLHALSGEPESCKGWLAVQASAEQIAAGAIVLYIDFEDTAKAIVSRLDDLAADPAAVVERLRYVRPDEPLDERGWHDLAAALALDPALVVIDGVTEALARHGLDLADNTDVAKWLDLLPRPLAARGAAVLLLDHVVKDREARGRYAIGAQHKLAGVDVAYRLEVVQPFGRGREGLVKVKVTKDRPGHVRQHAAEDRIADLHLSSDGDGAVTVRLEAPLGRGEPFRPTVLMERISRAIEETPGLVKRDVRAIPGKSSAKDLALELLVRDGYVERRQDGAAHRHYPLRSYRAEDDETGADE